MVLGKSKEVLQATPSGSAGGPNVTAEGADIGAYQPPSPTDCDLLVDDDWPSDEDSDGDNKFSTITAAINSASPQDLIGIKSGTYEEALTVNKTVSIASISGPKSTTIDAGGSSNAVFVSGGTLKIKGLKIKNFTTHGINFQDGSHSHVESNILLGSGASSIVQAFSDVKNVVVFNNITKDASGVWKKKDASGVLGLNRHEKHYSCR
ncbi:hypothetical protein AKJ64_05215 [candidate division MSBL1 archaeon SCGC-AAA259E17]|uniref:DUF1565 domain-containing protein n=1 Tax=candidate division MSBL1 archaeon SCGC-AAA259E17 TaxID=1698263 RepID=A0A133U9D2_9EURY|nr:hypothetical protein AKJ64_05215 [candidate division MSBL1 archaeon SCGC-AAA259E17]